MNRVCTQLFRNDTVYFCNKAVIAILRQFFAASVLLVLTAHSAISDISFEDVSKKLGVSYKGTSYGASWGDFNGDGWPDLWTGNHNTKPILYLNERGLHFKNIVDQIWSGDPKEDTHGAAWADFDNDGDQDLIELDNASENEDGTFCTGCGKTNFYVNEDGRLWERAAEYGLADEGLARSPLWLDADRDGKLDLLVVNTRRSGQPESTIYLQKNDRFVIANNELAFVDRGLKKTEKLWGRVKSLMRFEYPSVPYLQMTRHLEYAQMADLSADGYPDLVLFSNPSRIFSIGEIPFDDITYDIGLPVQHLPMITEVAIADFNSDQKMDMYINRTEYMPSDVVRTSPNQIKGYVTCKGVGKPKAVAFKAAGDVIFKIYPTWLPLSKIYIGSSGHHPSGRQFTLRPEDTAVEGPPNDEAVESDGISITRDALSEMWRIDNFNKSIFVDFTATASESIPEFQTIAFSRFREWGKDLLLLREKDKFVAKELTEGAGMHSSCYFVVAGDFDNDMDVDLYQTCTGSARNLPNRLLENDGKGGFRLVPGAGGAAGSPLGRGDVAAVADFDRDGFLDIFVANGHDPTSPLVDEGPHQFFHNLGNDNHWLMLDLKGVKSNRDGIGTRMELTAGNVVQIREQNGGMHRITQNHQRVHFGLGKSKKAESLTIYWPSGTVQTLNDIKADQILQVVESSQ